MNQEASADKGASNIIRQWIESGEVAIGENGMPNIIRNEESMQEESMWIIQVTLDNFLAVMLSSRNSKPQAMCDWLFMRYDEPYCSESFIFT